MPIFNDQLGRNVDIKNYPRRIVSLVPSQTELLHHIGLEEEVIGITKFCVHPEHWFRSKTRIGGTKQLSIEKIRSLQPDLIIANKEENVKDQVELLQDEFPVWISDVQNLPTAYEMMLQLGIVTGKKEEAQNLVLELQQLFQQFKITAKPTKVAYLIWQDPYMTIGGDTFIHHMLLHAGFVNVFGDKKRYPQIEIADIIAKECQIVFLSSEPYPFQQKHIEALSSSLPNTEIILVDGELFSWYGSRLLQAPQYFFELRQKLSHPSL